MHCPVKKYSSTSRPNEVGETAANDVLYFASVSSMCTNEPAILTWNRIRKTVVSWRGDSAEITIQITSSFVLSLDHGSIRTNLRGVVCCFEERRSCGSASLLPACSKITLICNTSYALCTVCMFVFFEHAVIRAPQHRINCYTEWRLTLRYSRCICINIPGCIVILWLEAAAGMHDLAPRMIACKPAENFPYFEIASINDICIL